MPCSKQKSQHKSRGISQHKFIMNLPIVIILSDRIPILSLGLLFWYVKNITKLPAGQSAL